MNNALLQNDTFEFGYSRGSHQRIGVKVVGIVFQGERELANEPGQKAGKAGAWMAMGATLFLATAI